MHVILFQPEIPQNTGNIIRSCAAFGARLSLIRPLGFQLDEKHLRRAGLDYHEKVDLRVYNSLEEALDEGPFFFFTSKATRLLSDVPVSKKATLIFGSETTGLPEAVLHRYQEDLVKIPMIPGIRCLNLSNAVAIGLYAGFITEPIQQTL